MSRALVNSALYVIRFAGAAAALWGIAYAINGATQAGGYITVQATPTPEAADHLRLSGVRLPADVALLHQGEVPLHIWGSTVAEQVLSRADVLLSGLCAGAAAWLLHALLNSIAEGRPFDRRNPARTAWLATLAIVSSLGSLLPAFAGAAVLDRAGLAGEFLPSFNPSWAPLAGGGLLLSLALALHAGARTLIAAGQASQSAPRTSS
ncbi:hypothetical protein [Nonomuraea jabiensis]|uniref:hypothetical protein n=1 Tax=Nonomuraea jabiensis TaxID=882448 RepID=UPI00369AFE88